MKEFQLCGLGNALVDIFLELSDAEFAALGFERGTMRLVDAGEQKQLLERFKDREPRLVSRGSAARRPTWAASATTATASFTSRSLMNSTATWAIRSFSPRRALLAW